MTTEDFPYDMETIREWAEENGLSVVDTRDRDGNVTCVFHDGREVEFHSNGAVVLRQHRMIGGAEEGDLVEFNDTRLEVSDTNGTSRVSYNEFPIDW